MLVTQIISLRIFKVQVYFVKDLDSCIGREISLQVNAGYTNYFFVLETEGWLHKLFL